MKMYQVGPPVAGAELIGREKEINDIISCFKANINTTVYGMPRIGKTSIVNESIARMEQQYSEYVFFRYNLTSSSTWRMFFSDFTKWLKTLSKKKDICDEVLNNKLNHLFNGETINEIKHRDYIDAVKEIRNRTDINIWIIIDEMDKAPKVMQDYIEELREICNSNWIRILTVSRLSINTIYPSDSGGSNFPGVFTKDKPIKGFSKNDLQLFFKDLNSRLNRDIDDIEKDIFNRYGGNKPYFLCILANLYDENTQSVLDESIVVNAIYPIYEKWAQALIKMGCIDGYLNVSQLKKKQRQMLYIYDIVETNEEDTRFKEISFSNYLSELFEEQMHEEDLNELNSWIEQLKFLKDDITHEITDTMGRDRDRYQKLQTLSVEIDAMICKIECCTYLSRLNTSFQCIIDEREMYVIRQKIIDIREMLE